MGWGRAAHCQKYLLWGTRFLGRRGGGYQVPSGRMLPYAGILRLGVPREEGGAEAKIISRLQRGNHCR
jgi:hypothetical protein